MRPNAKDKTSILEINDNDAWLVKGQNNESSI